MSTTIIRQPPTFRQLQVLKFIKKFQAENEGVSPSNAEIAAALGGISAAGAQSIVSSMIKRGLVTRGRWQRRTIQIVPEKPEMPERRTA